MNDAGDDQKQQEAQRQPRKIIKAKRKNKDKPEEKLVDEDGNELSFEDDSDELQDQEHIDDVVVEGNDSDDWVDQDGSDDAEEVMEDEGAKKAKAGDEVIAGGEAGKDGQVPENMKVWNEEQEPLKPDEELDFDSSAYEMLHRSEVEWPCLSIDILVRERCPDTSQSFTFKDWFQSSSLNQLGPDNSQMNKKLGIQEHTNDKYPMSVYFCGGSQGMNKNENKIYVMKWSEMVKTLHDDDVPEENSEDDEQDMIDKLNRTPPEPVIRFESIPHRGCVNRVRALCGSPIVATWSDEGEVGVYNV